METRVTAKATWERSIMLERQREGIAKTKAEGKYKGRRASINAYEVKRAWAAWSARPPPSNHGSPTARYRLPDQAAAGSRH
jgi:DNA invertase Pin-like site-specific DNA recombinase